MKKNFKQGNTNIMILAVIIFAALIYFNVDLRSIVDGFLQSPVLQKLLEILNGAWVRFIMPLGIYLWESITGLIG